MIYTLVAKTIARQLNFTVIFKDRQITTCTFISCITCIIHFWPSFILTLFISPVILYQSGPKFGLKDTCFNMPEVSRKHLVPEKNIDDGILKFEVILEDAKTKKLPRPKSAPAPVPKYEDIQEKLKV